MFSSNGGDSLFSSDPSESRSLFGGRECNELRVTKPPNRYGAVAAPDTKWITSPERCLQHKLHNTDTLQGISIKYSVPIELIKNVNKLWNHDQLFLRDVLLIPVPNTPSKCQNGSKISLPEQSHDTSSREQAMTSSMGVTSASAVHHSNSEDNTRHAKIPDDDKMLDNLFSRFDSVLQTTREATTKLRSNSNLDFSPQLANVSSLTSVFD